MSSYRIPARAISKEYGLPFVTALRWVKEYGADAAREKARTRPVVPLDPRDDLDLIDEKLNEGHVTRDYRPVDAAFDRIRKIVLKPKEP